MSAPDPTHALNRLLRAVASNPFCRARLAAADAPLPVSSPAEFARRVPFTTKEDLVRDCLRHPPFGSNFTEPRELYHRFCQSSGTASGPLPVLDTAESWGAMLDVWDKVYDHAGVVPGDIVFFAFSFGPFLGFWTAFEAATRRGLLSVPGGGLGSLARVELMARTGATVVLCTPTYALRLAEAAAADPEGGRRLSVRLLLVAGEPGGSIPGTRERISAAWNGAAVRDHHGMTETGPVSFETAESPGSLVVDEEAFFAEVVRPESGEPADEGETGELVLTTLRRLARPLLRYRTGDLVRAVRAGDRLRLEGGILGRADDMVLVRGVNVYPAAVESVLRGFPEVVEFRVRHRHRGPMAELAVDVEAAPEMPDAGLADRIQVALGTAFALRIPVSVVPPGSLPRAEFKSKRWISE
jgi:phenylacetate-CoA ligase